jgi:hypothetical protein
MVSVAKFTSQAQLFGAELERSLRLFALGATTASTSSSSSSAFSPLHLNTLPSAASPPITSPTAARVALGTCERKAHPNIHISFFFVLARASSHSAATSPEEQSKTIASQLRELTLAVCQYASQTNSRLNSIQSLIEKTNTDEPKTNNQSL